MLILNILDLAIRMTFKHYKTSADLTNDLEGAVNLTIRYAFKIVRWIDVHPALTKAIMTGELSPDLKFYYRHKKRVKKNGQKNNANNSAFIDL